MKLPAEGWDIRETAWPHAPVAALRAWAQGAEIAWLDGAGESGFSLLCARPLTNVEQRSGAPAACGAHASASGWALLRELDQRVPRHAALPWPLGPGWVGYFGFELAGQLERVPSSHGDALALPLLRLGLFDRAIVLDQARRRAFAVRSTRLRDWAIAEMGARPQPDEPHEWISAWERAAARSAPPAAPALAPAELHTEWSEHEYEHAVARALDYIAAGDVYQVNLAQRLRLSGMPAAPDGYDRLRRENPSAYGALLHWPGGAVLSVSPELFLRLSGDRVLTRPIKGTRPRTGDDVLDDLRRAELLASEKDAAELAMIVDLHRNDLGRVCRYGSVHVTQPRAVEEHPSVFHTVADVVGELAPGRSRLDLLTACFPAGSISGVPKIRAMQIIDELEPAARGVYTGAIGCLSLDGQMTLSVAIRTIQQRGETGWLHVGGGIVADSRPAEEYAETFAKAAGILRTLCSAAPSRATVDAP